MSFRIIHGRFYVTGYSPDGDSIRFKADDARVWRKLDGRKVKLNNRGHAQLRIEAIDTLETHYRSQHQPLQWADAATLRLLELLGISGVEWYPSHSRIRSANDGVPGYILSRQTENQGRPVAFVFDDSLNLDNGRTIRLNAPLMRKSVNFRLIAEGLAYPAFYDGLFRDLRDAFIEVQHAMRAANDGLWRVDRSNKYTRYETLDDITERYVMFPKMFRRLAAYMRKNPGTFDPWAFRDALEERPERVFVMRTLHFTHFDNVIRVSPSGRIRMTERPEDLIFIG